MSSTQLKLDQLWNRHEPSFKPTTSFPNTNEIKVCSIIDEKNRFLTNILYLGVCGKYEYKITFISNIF